MSANLESIYSEFNLSVDNGARNTVCVFDDYRLDAPRLMLYRSDREISLPPKAIETLLALIEKGGAITSKEELMVRLWPDAIVEESNLSHYLYLLRKTLGTTPDGKPYIETFRRRGYRFNGDVCYKSTETGQPGDLYRDRSAPTGRRNSAARSPHVERRGNVLAIADWRDLEPEIAESDPTAASGPKRKFPALLFMRRRRLALAAVVCVITGAAMLSFTWMRSSSSVQPAKSRAEISFTLLTNGEDVNDATISPDGKYFVYHETDGDNVHMWLQQVGQENRLEITPAITGGMSGKTFSPDSQFIYFVAWEKGDSINTLYRVPTLGGARTKILTDISSPVSFSPDGRQFVFGRNDQNRASFELVVAEFDGSGQRVLLLRDRAEAISYASAAWSPDGRTIAFGELDQKNATSSACSILGIDAEKGVVRSLSSEKWDSCYRAAWTRDGQGLVFIGTRANESLSTRRDQVYYLSATTGESRRLSTDGSRYQIASLGVSDAGGIMAVPFHRPSQIWSIDPGGDSRTAVQVTSGQADGRGAIAPLADGRLAFLTRSGDGFSAWVINQDGSNRTQLLAGPPTIEGLTASSDGTSLVFAAKSSDGHFHLFSLKGNADLQQITFGETTESDATIASDGDVIYCSVVFDGSRRQAGLRKIRSGSDESAQLGNTDCAIPHLSPNGKFVSCVGDEKIFVLSASDGSLVNSFDAIEQSDLSNGAKWTPDSSGLVFISRRKNRSNLWVQPLTGDSPRQLTDFTGGEVYNFAFSLDGMRLFLARGYPSRDAVLIANYDG